MHKMLAVMFALVAGFGLTGRAYAETDGAADAKDAKAAKEGQAGDTKSQMDDLKKKRVEMNREVNKARFDFLKGAGKEDAKYQELAKKKLEIEKEIDAHISQANPEYAQKKAALDALDKQIKDLRDQMAPAKKKGK